MDQGAPRTGLTLHEAETLFSAPISGRGLLGRVVNTIGMRDHRRRLAPGTSLPNEADLCTQLGVSRTIVREATKVLASKGLLESRPKTGTRVRAAGKLEPARSGRARLAVGGDAAGRVRARDLRAAPRLRADGRGARGAARLQGRILRIMAAALDAMDAAGDDGRRFIGPDTRSTGRSSPRSATACSARSPA